MNEVADVVITSERIEKSQFRHARKWLGYALFNHQKTNSYEYIETLEKSKMLKMS